MVGKVPVGVDAHAQVLRVDTSRLPPQAIVAPGEGVAVGIDDWHQIPIEVVK